MVTMFTLDIMKWKWHIISVAFLSKTCNPRVVMIKISEKFQYGEILQNTLPVVLKILSHKNQVMAEKLSQKREV